MEYRGHSFERGTIVDVVVKPDFDVVNFIAECHFQDASVYIIDTLGNFRKEGKNNNSSSVKEEEKRKNNVHNSSLVMSDDITIISNDSFATEDIFSEEETSKKYSTYKDKSVTIYQIHSLNRFLKTIDSLREFSNFTLVIDTITLVCDKEPFYIKNAMCLLWSLIYKTDCLILCINHYRIEYDGDGYVFVPRMGKRYSNMVSSRILVNVNDKIDLEFKNKP